MDAQPRPAYSGIVPGMIPRLPLALLVTLAIVPFSTAQNFSGSDTFDGTVINPSNWGTELSQNGGAFTANYGSLNFTDSGATWSTHSSAMRSWILNVGSYTADWQVQIDFTLNTTLIAGQSVDWTMVLANSDSVDDYIAVTLSKFGDMAGNPSAKAAVKSNGSDGPFAVQVTTNPTTATMYVGYIASSETLIAAYDSGSGLTNLLSVSVGSSGQAWNMTSGSTFQLSIKATNAPNAGPTSALVEGVFTADNFLASATTPVPEPSTYALLAGLAALGVVAWRRRS